MFSGKAWGQYVAWPDLDRRIFKKLNGLLEDCRRSPFARLGKPEPLRGELAGYWSRRIDDEHRLVYRVATFEVGQSLVIVQCRYHY